MHTKGMCVCFALTPAHDLTERVEDLKTKWHEYEAIQNVSILTENHCRP